MVCRRERYPKVCRCNLSSTRREHKLWCYVLSLFSICVSVYVLSWAGWPEIVSCTNFLPAFVFSKRVFRARAVCLVHVPFL